MEARRNKRGFTLSIVAVVLMSLIVPAAASLEADPKIAFLNPSSFADAGERGYVISDSATDSGPGCCNASDGVYRFSAWVDDAPEGSSVFFTVVQGALDFELPAVKPASGPSESDTWEASWEMSPEVLNGPATVHAYLVKDNEPVAQASVDVTIMRVSQAVDIAYPANGGVFGTYAPLASALPESGTAARKKPIGIVDALYTYTPDAAYVRAFYTTSAPGSAPRWKVCATDQVQIFADPDDGVRCTIDSAGDAAALTAVAAVVNSSPGDFDPRFNQSGDAVRVVPYLQQPAALTLDESAEQRVSKNQDADVFYCSGSVTATLTDQLGRAVPGANVDVKAAGPTDGLKFDTSAVFGGTAPPDRGNHTVETAYDCSESSEEDGVPPTNPSPDTQGEHPLFGSPDVKHVESPDGTDDLGTYAFALHANAAGVTHYTVWSDEADDGCLANDDRYTAGEPAAAGSIGWNAGPEPPALRVPDPLVPCGTTPGPVEPPGPGARTVGLRSNASLVQAGATVRLSGRVRSEAACVAAQAVKLKARRPGGRFHAIATGSTRDSGRFAFRVTVRRTRDYRALVPATGACASARSRSVRVEATGAG